MSPFKLLLWSFQSVASPSVPSWLILATLKYTMASALFRRESVRTLLWWIIWSSRSPHYKFQCKGLELIFLASFLNYEKRKKATTMSTTTATITTKTAAVTITNTGTVTTTKTATVTTTKTAAATITTTATMTTKTAAATITTTGAVATTKTAGATTVRRTMAPTTVTAPMTTATTAATTKTTSTRKTTHFFSLKSKFVWDATMIVNQVRPRSEGCCEHITVKTLSTGAEGLWTRHSTVE